ncbi:MAG: archaellin/type IV pilin N-terminal domain-containing protein [Candidatus Bathyarchaeia archaeon]
MGRRLRMDKRGISPVVATVILVAVTIVVAVAVAYWMGGITGLYTKFEKLEIVSIYAEKADFTSGNTTTQGFKITVVIKNTGSADATIDNVLLNGKLFNQYTNPVITVNGGNTVSIPINVGKQETITIEVSKATEPFVSGVSIEVRLHSAAGQEYPKTVSLP